MAIGIHAPNNGTATSKPVDPPTEPWVRQEEIKAEEFVQPPAPPVVIAPRPSNWFKEQIYVKESGNDPKKWNGSGCVGIGQACPASKLLAVCPTLEYNCEDAWFTGYMLGTYGSWESAYAWWIRTDCRKHGGPVCYPGHWW